MRFAGGNRFGEKGGGGGNEKQKNRAGRKGREILEGRGGDFKERGYYG
jgi:hypothetical protein